MEYLGIACQIIIGLGLINVWLFRPKKETPYRGGDASDMKEEFSEYGLPGWFMWLVGALKVLAAFALLVGVFVPELVLPAASLLIALMIGAVVMHIKVKDPARKSLPAASVLLLSLVVALA